MASRPIPVPPAATSPARSALADLSPDLLAILRPGGEVVEANAAWEAMLGFTPGSGIDRFRELVHPDDRLAFEEVQRTLLRGHDVDRLILRVCAGDGTWHETEWTCRADADAGVITLHGRDVTDDRRLAAEHDLRARRLERTNAELQEFAYVASHDLSEPLRMVTSYLDLVKRRYDDRLDDTGREFIHYAVDGAQRMRALIDDLLLYSRAGGPTPEHEPVDLDAVVAAVRRDLEGAIAEAGATVEVGPLGEVPGDASQLGQLLQNLIANAVKFRGPDRAPVVRVTAERRPGELVLTVADNGIGIAEKDAERIFQVFTRLHPRDEYPGTGIGLSICRRICERHGGRIEVRSAPGEGTTFVMTLADGSRA